MSIQALVQMNRLDLAQKELKKMLDTNEDDVLTQLTLAMVNLSLVKWVVMENSNVTDR